MRWYCYPYKEKLPGKFNMPYINSRFLFPLIVVAALVIARFVNKNYFNDLFQITEENASFNISTIIFWCVMIVLSIVTFIKNWSLIPLLGYQPVCICLPE
jgi:hypothetical protein